LSAAVAGDALPRVYVAVKLSVTSVENAGMLAAETVNR
jgi:hypothetical protein